MFMDYTLYYQMKRSYSETDLKYVNSKTHFPKRSRESGYGSAYVVSKVLCIYIYNSSKSKFYLMAIFIPLQAIITMKIF